MIAFQPLKSSDFPFLPQWMNTPHVAQWWGEEKYWSYKEISEKYQTYTEGYKLVQGQKKPLHSYVIYKDDQPIGYIQYYDTYDFPREQGYVLKGLPEKMASLDLYIGNPIFINKGLGAPILCKFIESFL